MNWKRTAVAAMIGAMAAMPAAANVINFDNLGNGVVVTNQYSGVTFSSSSGSVVLTTAQAASFGTSTPNFICSGVGFSINCSDPVFLDFTAPVSGLSFLAVGDNDKGVIGTASVFAGASLLGSVDIIGDGAPFDAPILVDLTGFSGITRLEITTTDLAGLGYDDFTFKPGRSSPTPEPASWALMLAGFGSIGGALRKSRRIAVAFG